MENNTIGLDALRRLVRLFSEYDQERDAEWEYIDEYGYDHSEWDYLTKKDHAELLDSIDEKRRKVNEYLHEIAPDLGICL